MADLRVYSKADAWGGWRVVPWVVCWASSWVAGMAKRMVARLAQSRAVLRVSLLAGSMVFEMVELKAALLVSPRVAP